MTITRTITLEFDDDSEVTMAHVINGPSGGVATYNNGRWSFRTDGCHTHQEASDFISTSCRVLIAVVDALADGARPREKDAGPVGGLGQVDEQEGATQTARPAPEGQRR